MVRGTLPTCRFPRSGRHCQSPAVASEVRERDDAHPRRNGHRGGWTMTNGTATTTDLDIRLEKHRTELTGYCYRMLGSSFEAEDAVQDTMVRAWRSYDKFE